MVNPERAAAIIEARERYAAALCDAAIAWSRDLADGVEPVVAVATMITAQRRALDAAIASIAEVATVLDPHPAPVGY